jgi:hypothetical protein
LLSSRDAIPTPPCGVHHSLQKKKVRSVSGKMKKSLKITDDTDVADTKDEVVL